MDGPGGSSETGTAHGEGEKNRIGGDRVDGGVSNHSDGVDFGHGGGENAGDNNGYLDGDGVGDIGGGDIGDQSTSDIHEVRETFTTEQMELNAHKFEEGYDLYDPACIAWLEVTHPEAVYVDRYMV